MNTEVLEIAVSTLIWQKRSSSSSSVSSFPPNVKSHIWSPLMIMWPDWKRQVLFREQKTVRAHLLLLSGVWQTERMWICQLLFPLTPLFVEFHFLVLFWRSFVSRPSCLWLSGESSGFRSIQQQFTPAAVSLLRAQNTDLEEWNLFIQQITF